MMDLLAQKGQCPSGYTRSASCCSLLKATQVKTFPTMLSTEIPRYALQWLVSFLWGDNEWPLHSACQGKECGDPGLPRCQEQSTTLSTSLAAGAAGNTLQSESITGLGAPLIIFGKGLLSLTLSLPRPQGCVNQGIFTCQWTCMPHVWGPDFLQVFCSSAWDLVDVCHCEEVGLVDGKVVYWEGEAYALCSFFLHTATQRW